MQTHAIIRCRMLLVGAVVFEIVRVNPKVASRREDRECAGHDQRCWRSGRRCSKCAMLDITPLANDNKRIFIV